ncbi:UNVERIFIED_CONTAM: hypothetical protein HDU68_007972 [Siphonaria sp. JEL0065]|nr:hypothetical protein HDU68_007972 [Siphonaria sp. JEL0065]
MSSSTPTLRNVGIAIAATVAVSLVAWRLTKPKPKEFTVADIPSVQGKTFLVTGGNAGLGYETCLQLSKKNAGTIILAARSEQKAMEAIDAIKREVPTAVIQFLKLDLSNLKQVDAAAKDLIKKGTKIDVLINNGGIYNTPFALTVDGIEETFAVNYVGHFHLTRTLLPLLSKSSEPRIVNLSSGLHAAAPANGIAFNGLNDAKTMNGVQRYAQSKLAMVLFTTTLNKRYGGKIYVNAADPGYTATKMASKQDAGFLKWMDAICLPLFGRSVSDGALTQLYLATSPEVVEKQYKGLHFSPIASKENGEKGLSALAKDDTLAEKLWVFTEDLVKEKLGGV